QKKEMPIGPRAREFSSSRPKTSAGHALVDWPESSSYTGIQRRGRWPRGGSLVADWVKRRLCGNGNARRARGMVCPILSAALLIRTRPLDWQSDEADFGTF